MSNDDRTLLHERFTHLNKMRVTVGMAFAGFTVLMLSQSKDMGTHRHLSFALLLAVGLCVSLFEMIVRGRAHAVAVDLHRAWPGREATDTDVRPRECFGLDEDAVFSLLVALPNVGVAWLLTQPEDSAAMVRGAVGSGSIALAEVVAWLVVRWRSAKMKSAPS